MSLDITIIDDEENPIESIGINADDHYQLIHKAENEDVYLIERMNDYYADAYFSVDDLYDLANEVNKLIPKCESDVALTDFLKSFSSLIKKSQTLNMPIQVLAD